jgi:hypothetical protein
MRATNWGGLSDRTQSMKVGDVVRVVRIPEGLRDDDDLQTKTIFERCLGRCFPVIELDGGFVQLHVGEVVGEASYMHSIYIEPEFIEVVGARSLK